MKYINTTSMTKTQLLLLVAKARSCLVICFFFKDVLKYTHRLWIYFQGGEAEGKLFFLGTKAHSFL